MATRARFLRVGRRVFAKHGFDATSVAMLCRAARTTHGALYHHFPGKEALFAAVLEELNHEVGQTIRRAIEGAEGWHQIEAACGAYLDVCTDPVVQQLLFRDGPRVLPADVFDTLDHGVYEPLVMQLLSRWTDEGLIRPCPIPLTARMLGGAFEEAGAMISAAATPKVARDQAETILMTWISTLRSTSLVAEHVGRDAVLERAP